MSLADKVTMGPYNFVFLIVEILLLALLLIISFSLRATDKAQYFVHSSFSSTLQLINGISSDLQKLLRYSNGTGIVAFFKILFALPASIFPNNLALYWKDLKSPVFSMSELKIVASSLEWNYKLPIVSG